MERQFSDLIILLASGINQRRMYFDNHPKVQSISAEFVEKVRPMLSGEEEDEFAFGVFGSKFIRHGKYLVGPSIAGRSLIEFAERLGCGGFVFRLPIERGDLVKFFSLGAGLKDDLDSLDDARAMFAAAGLDHIELTTPFAEGGQDGEGKGGGKDEETAEDDQMNFMAADFAPLLRVYQALYETVATNNLALNGDNRIDLDLARARGAELVAVSDQNALDVMQFMRYPDFDSYTIGHSVRVAALGALLARELGWSKEMQNEIATAGLLHDLGKGRVPDEILFKPGRLSDDERQVMETHPVLGVRVLLANGETSAVILAAAWGHHLREDRRGYPAMPEWFTRSSAAALIHVCDVFEALTAARPYKKPMTPRRAYEIMVADEGAFHPHMLAALIRALGLYPPGSEIVLSDQRRAVVVAKGSLPERPLVRVTHDAEGLPLSRASQPAINLSETPELEISDFVKVGLEQGEGVDMAEVVETA
ncbi:MAG: HD-GYP domain-containing protein [Candidatus Krumholzibacteria bacterium]|nr:HD-GYP domain-containing protein [Candidatus Krumholzibacteria bacterium]